MGSKDKQQVVRYLQNSRIIFPGEGQTNKQTTITQNNTTHPSQTLVFK